MEPDLARLQGRWSQVAFEENAMTDAPDSHGADGAVMSVTGCRFHVAIPGQDPLIEGSFVMDASQDPGCIDWTDSIGDDAGKIIPAIYELKGDRFRFAAADPGMPRPEGFCGGQGITIRSFIRIAG